MLALPLLLLTAGGFDTAESADFSKELQLSVLGGTVRVTSSDDQTAEGSGVIVHKSAAFLYILTANHVVGNGGKLEIAVYSGDSYPKPSAVLRSAEVISREEGITDLALVRVTTPEPPGKVLRLCPPRRFPAGRPFPGLAAGCSEGKAPTCVPNQVRGKKLVRKKGEEGTALFWEVERKPSTGMSGGPLVDTRGYVVGICSGASGDRGYYTHAEEIHRFLARSGLKRLYDEGE